MIKCCSHETFLHFGPQGSRLSICYYHQDLHQRPMHSVSRRELLNDLRVCLLVEVYIVDRASGHFDGEGKAFITRAGAPSIFGANPFGR